MSFYIQLPPLQHLPQMAPERKTPAGPDSKPSLELRDQFINIRPGPWIPFPGDTALQTSRAPSHIDINNKVGTAGFSEVLKRYNRKSLSSDALFHIYHRSRLNLSRNLLRFQYSSSWSQVTIHPVFCTQSSVMDACILSSPNPLKWIPRFCPPPTLCNGSLDLVCFFIDSAYHQDCSLFWPSWLLYPDSDFVSFCFLVHTTVYLAFALQSGNKQIPGQLSLPAHCLSLSLIKSALLGQSIHVQHRLGDSRFPFFSYPVLYGTHQLTCISLSIAFVL